MKKLCYEITGTAFPLRLIQNGTDRFTVEYGDQKAKGLSYGEAAKEFGLSLMHSLACDGKLDNADQ